MLSRKDNGYLTKFWNKTEKMRLISFISYRVIFIPFIRISPASTSYNLSISFTIVVFPEPFIPIKEILSP